MIRDRMARLRRDLEQVSRTRGLHRARRHRAPWPVVALVGYTNAGKSTLFNTLTGARVMAQDLLFATLDPTMRQVSLPGIDKAILSDTVGFVSDLPTQLVAAFRATLEEVTAADLIVHVRDISHPDTEAQAADVLAVLAEIGAAGEGGAPIIEAWNKIDLLGPEERNAVLAEAARKENVVAISAVAGEGLDTLRTAMTRSLAADAHPRTVTLDVRNGSAIAWLHAHGEVVESVSEGETVTMTVRITDTEWARFNAMEASA
jgi:GTP-binding protein HflX